MTHPTPLCRTFRGSIVACALMLAAGAHAQIIEFSNDAATGSAETNKRNCDTLNANLNATMQKRAKAFVPEEAPSSQTSQSFDISSLFTLSGAFKQISQLAANAFQSKINGILSQSGLSPTVMTGVTGVMNGQSVSSAVSTAVTSQLPGSVGGLSTQGIANTVSGAINNAGQTFTSTPGINPGATGGSGLYKRN